MVIPKKEKQYCDKTLAYKYFKKLVQLLMLARIETKIKMISKQELGNGIRLCTLDGYEVFEFWINKKLYSYVAVEIKYDLS